MKITNYKDFKMASIKSYYDYELPSPISMAVVGVSLFTPVGIVGACIIKYLFNAPSSIVGVAIQCGIIAFEGFLLFNKELNKKLKYLAFATIFPVSYGIVNALGYKVEFLAAPISLAVGLTFLIPLIIVTSHVIYRK